MLIDSLWMYRRRVVVFALPAKCDNWYAATVYVQPLFTTMGYHKLLFGWADYWLNDRFYLVAMGCAT